MALNSLRVSQMSAREIIDKDEEEMKEKRMKHVNKYWKRKAKGKIPDTNSEYVANKMASVVAVAQY